MIMKRKQFDILIFLFKSSTVLWSSFGQKYQVEGQVKDLQIQAHREPVELAGISS